MNAMDAYTYVLIPILIFCARIIDVSIGTIRVIFISKGFKFFAPVLGFFEVIIWLLAIRQILENLSNVFCYIAYGAGFAAGTYVGIFLEEKLSVGQVIVRIITKKDANEMLHQLKHANYNVTELDAIGNTGRMKLFFIVVHRQDVEDLVLLIRRTNPNALYTIEDIRYVSQDIPKHMSRKRYFKFWRKSK
jgi:uncharacterized protein YebE (UPF0316 family)